jgi:hypothetical protein
MPCSRIASTIRVPATAEGHVGRHHAIREGLIVPSKQPKVFISYAREDADAARRLFNSLTEAEKGDAVKFLS